MNVFPGNNRSSRPCFSKIMWAIVALVDNILFVSPANQGISFLKNSRNLLGNIRTCFKRRPYCCNTSSKEVQGNCYRHQKEDAHRRDRLLTSGTHSQFMQNSISGDRITTKVLNDANLPPLSLISLCGS